MQFVIKGGIFMEKATQDYEVVFVAEGNSSTDGKKKGWQSPHLHEIDYSKTNEGLDPGEDWPQAGSLS